MTKFVVKRWAVAAPRRSGGKHLAAAVAIACAVAGAPIAPAHADPFVVGKAFNMVQINADNPLGLPTGFSNLFGINVTAQLNCGCPPPPGTTVTATQGTTTVDVPYRNSPALPSLFSTTIVGKLFTEPGDYWSMTVANGADTTLPIDTPQIANVKPPPFVTGVSAATTADGNQLTSMTLSWTIPADSSANNQVLYVKDHTLGNTIVARGLLNGNALPTSTTSLTLDSSALTFLNNHPNDQYSVQVTARISNSSNPLSTNPAYFEASAASYTQLFTPSVLAARASATVYLPAGASAPDAPNNFNFQVTSGGQPVSLDMPLPPGVTGFLFDTGFGDPNFQSVTLPDNPNDYTLEFLNGADLVDILLAPNTNYDFGTGGVSSFKVLGIDPPPDFLADVSFTGAGQFTGHVDPIATPEPATLALFGASLFGLGWSRRRRH